MRLTTHQRRRINRLAEEAYLRAGGRCPVDMDRALHSYGIETRHAHFKDNDVSGCLFFQSDGKPVIGVNITQRPQRQRFTRAHELGHFLLHPQRTAVDAVMWRNGVSAEGVDIQEVEANTFAAQLLMPDFVIRDRVGYRTELDEEIVEELKNLFDVSFMAMTIRLTSLGYFL